MTGRPALGFLEQVASARRATISGRVLVVVAHPDDETLGCGSLLPRCADVAIVHVTDGAPSSGHDAARHGFATRAAYAEARRAELAEALRLAVVPADRAVSFGIADQEACRHLAAIVRRLAPMLAGRDVVLTHAYEGGHPDHDAVAFAVQAAAALAGRARSAPTIVEMPLYRAGPDSDWLRGSFADDDQHVRLTLDEEQLGRKRAMVEAHASQRETLDSFDLRRERYRTAPTYDFTDPPNGGRVLYDGFGWPITSRDWPALVAAARAELGLA